MKNNETMKKLNDKFLIDGNIDIKYFVDLVEITIYNVKDITDLLQNKRKKTSVIVKQSIIAMLQNELNLNTTIYQVEKWLRSYNLGLYVFGDLINNVEEYRKEQLLPTMSVQELIKKYYEHQPNGHYFDEQTLNFFGETVSKMKVLSVFETIKDCFGNIHKCYVLKKYSANYPGGGRWTYAYFDCETFEDITSY